MRNALLLATVLLTATTARAEIAWRPDLKSAHDEASASGKLIMVHFYSDNCVWCDRLEQGAFRDPAVAKAIEAEFVPVKINGPQQAKITSAFSVSRYPTDVIVGTDGSVISHRNSPRDTLGYLAMLTSPEVTERIAGAARPTDGSTPVQNPTASPAAQVAASAPATPSPQAAHTTQASVDSPANPAAPIAADSSAAASFGAPTGVAPSQHIAGPGPEFAGFALPPGIAAGNFDMGAYQGTAAMPASQRTGASMHFAGFSGPANSPSPAPGAEAAPGAGPQTEPAIQNESHPELDSEPQAVPAAVERQELQELPPEAMDGYCAVTVVDDGRWAPGSAEFGVIHLGHLYLFASAEAKQKFIESPNRYTPALNGIDVVKFFDDREIVAGRREYGYIHGRMFLFADEASMNHFYAHFDRYTDRAIELTERAAADANR